MPLKRPPQPTPEPPVTPPAPPEPAKPPKPDPQGVPILGSYGNASIDRWDTAFVNAVDAVKDKRGVRIDPHFLKAMMEVESGGNGNLDPGWCRQDGSCGPMQIKPQFHQWRCPKCDFRTVPGQIELAAHIIGMTMLEKKLDEYGALLAVYFPSDDILNGTTQAEYVARVKQLVAKMDGIIPAKPQGDVIAVIVGGKPTNTSYGFKSVAAGDYYGYFEGHGGTRWQHTGIDATGQLGQPLFTPIDGTVVCAGTGVGQGAHGSGCAAFADEMVGGVGRVEVITDDGTRSLIFGHCGKSLVRVGQRVDAGQQVATMGGAGDPPGPHCHVEARIWRNGDYTIVDPRQAFGGGPLPDGYVDAVDIAQPDDTPPFVTVKATRATPVLQRGNPKGPKVLPDLPAGETFFAQHKVLGVDGRWYWVGRLRGRVAEADTEVVETTLP